MTARVLLAGVVGASLWAAVLTAAQSLPPRQQPPTFRANAELVEIDVVVVDKAGEPVHGLTRDDFVVRDRRKPQPVETFTEVRRALERTTEPVRAPPGARSDVSSNTSEQAGRLVVLVLDDLHVWRGRTNTVKEIAERIVRELGSESSMALLQTGQEHSTEVTSDRTRLLESINKFRGRREFRRPLGACDPSPLESKDVETVVAWGLSSGCNMEDVSANRGLYATLKDAARILGRGDQRRKAFILVSEHIAKDITGLFDGGTQIPDPPPNSLAYAMSGGDPRQLGTPAPVASHDYALLDMMNAMRRGNVATYAIDPRGEITPQELEMECHPSPPTPPQGPPDNCVDPFVWRSPIRQAQRGLEIVAGETGGFAIVNTDDFTSGIGRILTELDNYYLLGFLYDRPHVQGLSSGRCRGEGAPGSDPAV
jgi:VWFA-related protein